MDKIPPLPSNADHAVALGTIAVSGTAVATSTSQIINIVGVAGAMMGLLASLTVIFANASRWYWDYKEHKKRMKERGESDGNEI